MRCKVKIRRYKRTIFLNLFPFVNDHGVLNWAWKWRKQTRKTFSFKNNLRVWVSWKCTGSRGIRCFMFANTVCHIFPFLLLLYSHLKVFIKILKKNFSKAEFQQFKVDFRSIYRFRVWNFWLWGFIKLLEIQKINPKLPTSEIMKLV